MLTTFFVPGTPRAKARHHTVALKRCPCNGKTTVANQCPACGSTNLVFVTNVKLADKNTESYENWVALCAQQAGVKRPAESGPVALTATFLFPVPKSRQRKLTEGTPHTQRPDLDNCQKSLLDGLNRVAWQDDSCVVFMLVQKLWTHRTPGVMVELEYGKPEGAKRTEGDRGGEQPCLEMKSPFA